MPALPTPVVGSAAQLLPGAAGGIYYNTAATYQTPTWTENLIVKDVKPAFPWDFSEALSRQTPIKLYAKTLIDLPIQVVMRADPSHPHYLLWLTAHWSRTVTLDLLVLNSKITTLGATGIRGEWLVSLTEEAQEIGGIIYSTFELRPTLTATVPSGAQLGVPQWVQIGVGPTPAYTPLAF